MSSQDNSRNKRHQRRKDVPPPAARSGSSGDAVTPSSIGQTPEIVQGPRDRDPGDRGQRIREWIHLKVVELQGSDPSLSRGEAAKIAWKELNKLQRTRRGQEALKAFAALAPTSTSVPRNNLRDDVELAAVMRHPVTRWLRSFLRRKTNRRGFCADRSLVSSVFLQMAFGPSRPEISGTRDALLAGNTLWSWAHDYPGPGPSRSHFFQSLRDMLMRKPPEAVLHANVALLRELAELRDNDGNLLHPNVGRVAIVDAKGLEAETQQKKAKDDAHRMIIRRDDQQLVESVVYTRPDRSPWRFWVGYKLCVLVDMATTLPIVWCLIPANGNERDAARHMLRILFEMWPNCPLETLAGDSLYDGDEAFSFELVFDWGIQPVFVQHGKWSRKLDHHGTNGVPRCPCGAMKRKDTDNFYTAARRQREGIQRGERAPRLDARIRWVCPNGLPTHRGTTTRPADNARLYTFYPRGGEHELAYQRAAMLLRRNAVESVFSSLGEMGLAGKDHERPGWAGDVEVAWLLSCGFLYLTARRLAHETGAYEAARREAEELGLLEQPLLVNPAPGPSEFELARVRHDRRAAVGEERAPESWPADATEEPPGLGELEVA